MQLAWRNLNKPEVLVHLIFAVLLVLAGLFYEERLVADSGYYVFRVINNQSFWVEHDRYILALSQIAPWVGVHLGLSLKAILVLHSLGHVLFFYSVYWIARYLLKFKPAGPLLLLLQLLGIQEGFFVPMFELYYAAGLCVLLLAIWRHPQKRLHYWALPPIAFFILTSHFYAYIMLGLLIALQFAENGWSQRKQYLLLLTVMAGVSVLKKFNVTPYEEGKINAFISTLKHAQYGWSYLKNLAAFLSQHYLALLLVLFASLGMLLKAKKWQQPILILGSFLATLVLVNISHYGFETSRYQEQVYFTLSFIVALPFALSFFKGQKASKAPFGLWLLLLLVISYQISGILKTSGKFTGRMQEMQSLISQARLQTGTKFSVAEDYLQYDPNWSYPLETLLFSSQNGPEHSLTICTQTDYTFGENPKRLTDPNTYLFRRWEVYPLQRLNPTYFRLKADIYNGLRQAQQ